MFTDAMFSALLAGWHEFRLQHGPKGPEIDERLRLDAGLPPAPARLPHFPIRYR